MKLEILGSFGGNADTYRLTSLLVNDCLALDAGCLTSALTFERQLPIRNVMVSHAHSDHIGTLPYLIDNVFGYSDGPLRIHGSAAVIQALKDHVFNDVIWPDFSKLPSPSSPSMVFETLHAERPVHIGSLRVTPIPVNHLVPCTGFLVECQEQGSAFIYTADTAQTDRVWEIANATDNLKCVIVDCSFPNHLEDLAVASGHMTPQMLARDLKKLERKIPILVYHLKPSFERQMAEELDALGLELLNYRIQGQVIHI
ncbi:MAG: 3',5'-cyclic-nucleotide phosphodiesterase [Acidobacteria bacterium]|nr:3',5'-cyclic-nucleotide phosphodiesterase [Acidobacteriota bacterium]MCB9397390.1 3',5'-cyclic-nucleotide phosphodiesterase [Acidobacteriota bacterium]